MAEAFVFPLTALFAVGLGPTTAAAHAPHAQLVRGLQPEVLRRPAALQKPILSACNASWRQPCRRSAKEVLADEKAAPFINEHFVPVKVADEQRHAQVGARLVNRCGVTAFPTLVVVDGSGKVLAQQQGYPGEKKTLRFLQKTQEKAQSRRSSGGCL